MKTTTFRAFSAGVSLLTLGVAMPGFVSPAMAQHNGSRQTGTTNLYTVPGTYDPTPDQPSGDVSPDVNGNPGPAGDPDAANFARVTCADEATCALPGAIWQTGATPTGEVVNEILVGPGAFLTIQAFASGAGSGASAQITTDAIRLIGTAPTVSNTVNNEGTINVRVLADDLGAGGLGSRAVLNTGIEQDANGEDSATNQIINAGDLNIDVTARDVSTDGLANASASITSFGILQAASATVGYGVASAMFSNDGTMDIVAAATAVGNTANADALIDQGILQQATATAGYGDAIVGLENDGDLNILASASAFADAGRADAAASITGDVIEQAANASTDEGVATVSLTNNGTLNIGAVAFATGADGAGADAFVSEQPFEQSADGTDASVELTNNLGIEVLADARA
ncbi:MAG TPA: hypothetical protein VF637_16120, partial [Sphingomicrobium sp.]